MICDDEASAAAIAGRLHALVQDLGVLRVAEDAAPPLARQLRDDAEPLEMRERLVDGRRRQTGGAAERRRGGDRLALERTVERERRGGRAPQPLDPGGVRRGERE